MYIGKRIKELREMQNMKLVELARKSGVQIATLSRIEHLKMVGSLESHIAIASALGIDVTSLYSNMLSEEDKANLKNPKPVTNIFIHSNKSSYEILTPKVLNKRMMPILLNIIGNGKTNKEENAIGTEKFIFVLEGKIEVKIEKETYALAKHNTLYFNAAHEHNFVNLGKTPAKIICVSSPVTL